MDLLFYSFVVKKLSRDLTDENQGVGRFHSFLEVLGENLLTGLFQLLQASAFLGLWPLSPSLEPVRRG